MEETLVLTELLPLVAELAATLQLLVVRAEVARLLGPQEQQARDMLVLEGSMIPTVHVMVEGVEGAEVAWVMLETQVGGQVLVDMARQVPFLEVP